MRPNYRRNSMLRRSQAMWGNARVWRPRLVFWAGALAIGVVSVGFAELADIAQHMFKQVTGIAGWTAYLPLVITPAGFALSAYLAITLFPNSQGSGIPQAIAARHLTDDDDRERLLSLKMAAGKILLTVLGLLSGASIGREGPTVQVGASLMLQAARVGGMAHARGLILAGSAAGVAAAFNTPLAGIVFAIEEMGRLLSIPRQRAGADDGDPVRSRSDRPCRQLHLFWRDDGDDAAFSDWLLVILCGIGGGAFGAIFSAAALQASRRVRRWAGTATDAPIIASRDGMRSGSCRAWYPLRRDDFRHRL